MDWISLQILFYQELYDCKNVYRTIKDRPALNVNLHAEILKYQNVLEHIDPLLGKHSYHVLIDKKRMNVPGLSGQD